MSKTLGIKRPKPFLSDKIILKFFPKVLDFFLKSITQSKILPFKTFTNLD